MLSSSTKLICIKDLWVLIYLGYSLVSKGECFRIVKHLFGQVGRSRREADTAPSAEANPIQVITTVNTGRNKTTVL